MVYVHRHTALRKICKLKDGSFGSWDKLEEMFLPEEPWTEREELGEIAYLLVLRIRRRQNGLRSSKKHSGGIWMQDGITSEIWAEKMRTKLKPQWDGISQSTPFHNVLL